MTETNNLSKDHLQSLRQELASRKLDGFVIPRGDEHQGENVAAHSERLTWLTGFTGSAGQAVVLSNQAAIFIDGRYTLQVTNEVDGDQFEFCHLIDNPASDWIGANLGSGKRLGYDPWLHSEVQADRLSRACSKIGSELIPVETNPVDSAWRGRPAAPKTPVMALDIRYAGRSSQEKRSLTAKTLKTGNIDAAVLTAPDSIAWLLNIRGNDVPFTPLSLSFAVLHNTGEVDWFIDGRKLSSEVLAHIGNEVVCHQPSDIGIVLDKLGANKKTIRIETSTAPMWISERLKASGALINPGADPCQYPKACKTSVEIDGARAAHHRDGVALSKFIYWLAGSVKNGEVTELAASNKLEAFRSAGENFQGLSFPTIAGSGPNGAIVHYRVDEASNRKLGNGELFLLDSGGQYLDGTTDVTRTIAIGSPDEEMRHMFTLVLKGHIALAGARFPTGTSGSQLDILARRPLWEEGFDYDHGTGHGVGNFLGVHEGPHRISKHPNTVALEPGMIVSNEPGFYKEGAYGIRIENLVTVRAAAQSGFLEFETLTFAPIDRALIETEILSPPEKKWLNTYHAKVWQKLSPHLEKDEQLWLKMATEAI